MQIGENPVYFFLNIFQNLSLALILATSRSMAKIVTSLVARLLLITNLNETTWDATSLVETAVCGHFCLGLTVGPWPNYSALSFHITTLSFRSKSNFHTVVHWNRNEEGQEEGVRILHYWIFDLFFNGEELLRLIVMDHILKSQLLYTQLIFWWSDLKHKLVLAIVK